MKISIKPILKEIKKRQVILYLFGYMGLISASVDLLSNIDVPFSKYWWFFNIALALIPALSVLAWFHGEQGSQKHLKSHNIFYIIAVLLWFPIFFLLPKPIVPNYSFVSSHHSSLFSNSPILHKHADKNDYKLHVKGIPYDDDLKLGVVDSVLKKSTETLLISVPLIYANTLMNQNPPSILPLDSLQQQLSKKQKKQFDEILRDIPQQYRDFAKQTKRGGELYGFPFLCESNVLVYKKSKVNVASQEWHPYKSTISAKLESICGQKLDDTYLLENDPAQWTVLDIFVYGSFWQIKENNPTLGVYCIPNQNDLISALIQQNRFLANGSTIQNISNIIHSQFFKVDSSMVQTLFWDSCLKKAHIFNNNMWDESGSSYLEIIQSMNAATHMAILPTTAIQHLLSVSQTPEDITVCPLPQNNSILGNLTGSQMPNLYYLMVPSNTPNRMASIKLLLQILANETQLQMLNETLNIPCRTSILSHNAEARSTHLVRPFLIPQTDLAISPYCDFDIDDVNRQNEIYVDLWNLLKTNNFLQNDKKITYNYVEEKLLTKFILF